MAACTAIQGAGAGTLFTGDIRQLGRLVTKFSPTPRKLISWFILNEHPFLYHKCLGCQNQFLPFEAKAFDFLDGFLLVAMDGRIRDRNAFGDPSNRPRKSCHANAIPPMTPTQPLRIHKLVQ